MAMEDMEKCIMELVVNGGNARSMAIEAFRAARDGNFDEADEKMKDAEKVITQAHNTQTSLIQKALNGEKVETGLLMVHAQDHLMNAMTVMDLVREIIDLLQKYQNNNT